MNHQAAPTSSTPGFLRPEWRRRWLARGLWLAVVIPTLVIFSTSLPRVLSLLQSVCGDPSRPGSGDVGSYGCAYTQISPQQAAVLRGWGFSTNDYAITTLAIIITSMLLALSVSALIAWRRPDDRMAMLVALMLVLAGTIAATTNLPTNAPMPVPNACVYLLFVASFTLVFSQFPSGRFVPRWTRWAALVSITAQIPYGFFYIVFPMAPLTTKLLLDALGWLVLLGELAILVVVQVYRYRWVSTPLERQQTKWVVVGLVVPLTVYGGATLLLYLLLPLLARPDSLDSAAFLLVVTALGYCNLLLLPPAFGVAMLRYRLWDIDVLIRRTLVYGSLSVILTAIYVGLVIGLQTLLGRTNFIHQDNTLAVVISTLAIATLFQPLRRRIRRLIDRRFYRRMYDAEQTLSAFSVTLRQEMDLEQLRGQVLAVVQETMQPTQVSLWLRPSSGS